MKQVMNKKLLALTLVTILLWLGLPIVLLAYAPQEELTQSLYKIFYLHLPLAWWALLGFTSVFVCSLIFLVKRKRNVPSMGWDLWAESASETSLLFCALALGSGMIWAKLAWNTWWRFEPKLVTTLVVCLAYALCLLLRKTSLPDGRRRVLAAVFSILAFLDLPFIFMASKLAEGAHPPPIILQGGSLSEEMLLSLAYCLLAFGCLWLLFTILRFKQAKLELRLQTLKQEYFNHD